jgi:peptide/nickel transport system ATP-binding protein
VTQVDTGRVATGGSDAPLVRVEDLSVTFDTEAGELEVVQNVTFDVEAGSTVGLVGESGSGKSVSARAILGLVGSRGRISNGRVLLEGRDLTQLSQAQLRAIRGREIAMIFQEPRRSLDPAFKIGDQVATVARHALGLSRKAAWKRAIELLDLVHIPEPAKRAQHYPHQFSGGMCQRVMLALALAGDPKMLIADEPTTALDVTVQAHVLELIRELQREFGLGVLFITHDLAVVAEMCDRVVVMYAGQIVEDSPIDNLYLDPKHPYTHALLKSLPQLNQDRLFRIDGVMPSPGQWPSGCRFEPRCAHAVDACRDSAVSVDVVGQEHLARCIRAEELSLGGIG